MSAERFHLPWWNTGHHCGRTVIYGALSWWLTVLTSGGGDGPVRGERRADKGWQRQNVFLRLLSSYTHADSSLPLVMGYIAVAFEHARMCLHMHTHTGSNWKPRRWIWPNLTFKNMLPNINLVWANKQMEGNKYCGRDSEPWKRGFVKAEWDRKLDGKTEDEAARVTDC